jgi:hypothetical protein
MGTFPEKIRLGPGDERRAQRDSDVATTDARAAIAAGNFAVLRR